MVRRPGPLEIAFDVFNHAFLLLVGVILVAPLVLVYVSSITAESELLRDGYKFLPRQLGLQAWQFMFFTSAKIGQATLLSAFVTAVGSLGGMILTGMLAWTLSIRDLPFRRTLSVISLLPMYFYGGLIPSYIVYKMLGLINRVWILVAINLVNPFGIIMMRNYFLGLPSSLMESAKIDGASEWSVFRRVALPLSKPIVATILIMYAIFYWNDWVNPMFYTSKEVLTPLMLLLQRLMNRATELQLFGSGNQGMSTTVVPIQSLKMAIVVLATLPIIVMYPFLQRYFVQGATLGAVKE